MTQFQAAKQIVRTYMAEFEAAAPQDMLRVLKTHTPPDYAWRGMRPFYEQTGQEAVINTFWAPLRESFTALQRREDIFFAGLNDCDGQATTWTCSMGHFKGLFDAPWLGLAPTRKIVMIRYAEFHRVEDDKIAETALFIDLLSIMRQAGVWPLPEMTAVDFIYPGPRTNDGQLFEAQDPAEGEKTLKVIKDMASNINQANAVLQGKTDAKPLTPHEELSLTWHEDMAWYGPAGIGGTFTIDRYIEQHQQPFRRQLSDRKFNGHVARLAEGNYGGFFGWPNLSVTPSGGYLGMPASDTPADMRVVDVYRRDDDKLAENWIFIDILHFLAQQGRDILAELAER